MSIAEFSVLPSKVLRCECTTAPLSATLSYHSREPCGHVPNPECVEPITTHFTKFSPGTLRCQSRSQDVSSTLSHADTDRSHFTDDSLERVHEGSIMELSYTPTYISSLDIDFSKPPVLVVTFEPRYGYINSKPCVITRWKNGLIYMDNFPVSELSDRVPIVALDKMSNDQFLTALYQLGFPAESILSVERTE